MNNEEMRKEIYRVLGLEFGSLASESGYDWERAKKEIEEECKQKLQQNNNKKINYLVIDKNSYEFLEALNSTEYIFQYSKCLIAQRNDLTQDEIIKLIYFDDKDVNINIAKYQILNDELLSVLLSVNNIVYLVVKNILKYQKITQEIRDQLIKKHKLYETFM